jgi:SAM-dependent methyltransferase
VAIDLEGRSAAEIRAHYEVERELADRLRSATRSERRTLYSALYDELFQRVGSHPQLQRTDGISERAPQLRLIERYLETDSVFLEIGAGDCSLALAVADRVQRVYAIEVSAEITAKVPRRENLDVIMTDGLSIPVRPASVTLAYSNQVLEHLHPDDAFDHVRQVYTALAPGGRYICVTPNRLTGPHDISKYFDTNATGFHLREYTATELACVLRSAGFECAEAWTTRKGISLRIPWPAVSLTECVIERLPHKKRRRVGNTLPLRVFLQCYVVGLKAAGRRVLAGADAC